MPITITTVTPIIGQILLFPEESGREALSAFSMTMFSSLTVKRY